MMMVLHVNIRLTISRKLLMFTAELVFGFSPSKYEIHEDDESAIMEIFFQGIPGDYQPVVLISTHNGTAKGQQIIHNINAVK